MPIPSTVTFYNGIGKVNHVKLKEFLKEKEKVGYWNLFFYPYVSDIKYLIIRRSSFIVYCRGHQTFLGASL